MRLLPPLCRWRCRHYYGTRVATIRDSAAIKYASAIFDDFVDAQFIDATAHEQRRLRRFFTVDAPIAVTRMPMPSHRDETQQTFMRRASRSPAGARQHCVSSRAAAMLLIFAARAALTRSAAKKDPVVRIRRLMRPKHVVVLRTKSAATRGDARSILHDVKECLMSRARCATMPRYR